MNFATFLTSHAGKIAGDVFGIIVAVNMVVWVILYIKKKGKL